jgi:hypothetical protein
LLSSVSSVSPVSTPVPKFIAVAAVPGCADDPCLHLPPAATVCGACPRGACPLAGVPRGAPLGGTLWYTITARQAGLLSVTTAGSSYDTVLGVYREEGRQPSLSRLVPVAGNDDCAGDDSTSCVVVAARAGARYAVQVASKSKALSRGTLQLTATLQWSP